MLPRRLTLRGKKAKKKFQRKQNEANRKRKAELTADQPSCSRQRPDGFVEFAEPPSDPEYHDLEPTSYISVIDEDDDDLPYKYRHVRDGLRSVKLEYKSAIIMMQSLLHMSRRQAE